MPQAILLFRGRDQLPDRYFKLGALGPFVNATAVAWVLFVDILACFPATHPVSAQSMNYMSVVAVGLLSMVMIFWFTSRKRHFRGPSIDFARMAARRQAALKGNAGRTGV